MDAERELQLHIKDVLRQRIAYKIEGDVCSYLEENLDEYTRGEEMSRFDGGMTAEAASGSDRILTIEVKSAEISLQRATAQRHRHWYTYISGHSDQSLSDLICVGFPGLRNTAYVALRPAIEHPEDNERLRRLKTYSSSQTAQTICNPVPPPMWPRMLPLHALPDVLAQIRQQRLFNPNSVARVDYGDFSIALR